ncbi:MAG: YaaR family protein [Clostridiales bacterium]|jgi:uncharacterized protein YaaR (DUF327 family)|nr:YaaR family protein [Clostridiales bacterium]
MSVRVSSAAPIAEPFVIKRHEPAAEQNFDFTLNRLSDEGLADRLNTLLGNIAEEGNRLAERMDIRDMRQYRRLVSNFMNEVVTHSHEFSRENFLDKRGRHRVYGIVKLVNEDLDALAKNLLSAEKDRISVLDTVDEIRGLLLDLIA